MARKSNTTARRAEIVAAALAVIAEHGYEGATINAIAQRAGLAPGLLHYHFANKLEVLLELARVLPAKVNGRYAQLAEAATTPQQRLLAYIDSRLAPGEGADPQAVAAWVAIGAEATRQPEVRAVYEASAAAELQLAESLIAACIPEPAQRPVPPIETAAALVALINGAFLLACSARQALPTGFAGRAARRLVAEVLGAGAAGE